MGCFQSRRRKPHVDAVVTSILNKFPSEIHGMIIDCLWDDTNALHACSLTYRPWLQHTRNQIFSQVSLTPKKLLPFCRILEFPSTDLSKSVKRLRFRSFCRRVSQDPYAFEHFLKLLSTLHSVTSVAVSEVNFNYLPHHHLTTLPNVTRLDLKCLQFNTFSDFVLFVTSFYSLASFSFSEVTWAFRAFHPSTRRHWSSPPQISFLELNDRNATDFVTWLLEQVQTPTVNVLHFDTHRYTPNNAVRQLVEAGGESIVELMFDLTFANEIQDNLSNSVNLGLCPNLKTLHLHNIILLAGFLMTTRTTRWVRVLLSQVASNAVENVIFTLLVCRNTDLDCFDWPGTANALSRPPFTNLREVLFRIPEINAELDRDAAKQSIAASLPELAERGVLQVAFVPF